MYRTRDPLASLAEYVCPRCRFPVQVPNDEVLRWSLCPRDGWPLVAREAFLRSDGDPLLGLELDGGFVPISVAGSGATSTVYKARRSDGGLAAIKVLRLDGPMGERAMDAWRREVAALEGFAGPGVARMLDTGRVTHPPAFYIALDWVDGAHLDEDERPRTVARSLEIAAALCRALGELHARGIVHGDVKPSNIIVGPSGISPDSDTPNAVTVVDLGSSCVEGQRRPPFEDEGWIGSPAYASPEQLDGARLDRRADLYGLGGVLHRLLTGRSPFGGGSEGVARANRVVSPPLPSTANPDVPASVDELVISLLEKDRSRRPTSANSVLARLAALRAA